METLGILKFWRNSGSTAGDGECDGYGVRRGVTLGTDDEETDLDDSFFDLVFNSPARSEGESKKHFQFIESPRDVLHCAKNPQSPTVTFVRSTPKLKVFMLRFRKSRRCNKFEAIGEFAKAKKSERGNRFGAEEMELAAAPVFARESSRRVKQSCDREAHSPEKSVPKYLKLIKPFYVKASRRKTRPTDHYVTPSSSPLTAPVNFSPTRFSAGSFKIVVRNLTKSRSASVAAVGVVPPSVSRRDDSLLEQHDSIQGAILHCKKSFNSSSTEYSRFFPSPLHSFEEQKRCSI